jgi:PKD repeat protein
MLFCGVLAAVLLRFGAAGAFAQTFIVTSIADDGTVGTLRWAIQQADSTINDAADPTDTVLFDPTVFTAATPRTITLDAGLGQLSLTDATGRTMVQGPGAAALTISGGGATRVFAVLPGADAELSGMTIANGWAPSGGGVYNAGTAIVRDCTVSGNAATGPSDDLDGDGGGVYNSGTLTIARCTISNNTATNTRYWTKGGGIFNGGALTVTSSLIVGNIAANSKDRSVAYGGGLANYKGTVTIFDTTLSGNSVFGSGTTWSTISGGGVASTWGTITVINCTVSDNSAMASGTDPGAYGGGIYSQGAIIMGNTIVAHNTATSYAPDVEAYVTSLGFNLIRNQEGCYSLVSTDLPNGTDPRLAPLAANGGPTLTAALLPGSPAKNAGSNALIPDDPATGQPYTTDQRGEPRINNGVVDIGAFEAQNPYPTAEAGGPYSVPEGGSVTLSGGCDPDGLVYYEWDLDLDYVYDVCGQQNPAFSALSIDGPATHTVRLRVRDTLGDTGTDTAIVSILNVAPTVEAGTDPTTNVGAPLTFAGSFSDPGSSDDHTITWEFGDGTSPAAGTLTPTHTYAGAGTYTATLTVTDDDGGSGTDTVTVTVNNLAPVVNAGSDQMVDEGSTVTFSGSFDDSASDTHTIAWDFGDGQTATGTLTPTHTYTDDGAYTATLTVTDNFGASGSDTATITVGNVAPTATLSNSGPVAEGSPATVSFTGATDASGADLAAGLRYSFALDAAGLASSHAAAGVDASAPFSWPDAGSYAVYGRVIDKDGGYTDYSTIVSVTNYAPIVDAGPDQAGVSPGQTVSFAGSFDDPYPDAGYTITWDFGDGASASGTLTPTHVYNTSGSFTVTLTVTDDDGGVGVDTLTVTTVTNLSMRRDVWNRLYPLVSSGTLSRLSAGYPLLLTLRQFSLTLGPTYWQDAVHLRDSGGLGLFTYDQGLIRLLYNSIRGAGVSPALVGEVAAGLVQADRSLAAGAIAEAKTAAAGVALIMSAEAQLALGDAFALRGDYATAVYYYGRAWNSATQAY